MVPVGKYGSGPNSRWPNRTPTTAPNAHPPAPPRARSTVLRTLSDGGVTGAPPGSRVRRMARFVSGGAGVSASAPDFKTTECGTAEDCARASVTAINASRPTAAAQKSVRAAMQFRRKAPGRVGIAPNTFVIVFAPRASPQARIALVCERPRTRADEVRKRVPANAPKSARITPLRVCGRIWRVCYRTTGSQTADSAPKTMGHTYSPAPALHASFLSGPTTPTAAARVLRSRPARTPMAWCQRSRGSAS